MCSFFDLDFKGRKKMCNSVKSWYILEFYILCGKVEKGGQATQ